MDSDAVSLMSPFMLDVELAGGQLVTLPDLDLGIRARFGTAWMSGRTVSSATLAFVELLQSHDRAVHAAATDGLQLQLQTPRTAPRVRTRATGKA